MHKSYNVKTFFHKYRYHLENNACLRFANKLQKLKFFQNFDLYL